MAAEFRPRVIEKARKVVEEAIAMAKENIETLREKGVMGYLEKRVKELGRLIKVIIG